MKRHQHQPDRTFQEAELLYSFEQTSDEHWNEIRQEIVNELREDKNRESEKPSEEPSVHQPTSTSVPRARELADQIFRQAGENIRLKTGGTITIHPAALEYLEQVLDTQSGQSKQAVQPVGKQLQLTDRKSSDENTVIHRVERILDAYRVRQEPVKAAARSTKPKTMMTQAPAGVRSGEPGTMMAQQTPGQSGTVMVQQIPGQSGTMMAQQIPGQSETVMVTADPGTVRNRDGAADTGEVRNCDDTADNGRTVWSAGGREVAAADDQSSGNRDAPDKKPDAAGHQTDTGTGNICGRSKGSPWSRHR